MLFLIDAAQYGQGQRDCFRGIPRRTAEIPSHLQIWCWNKYIRHKVCDAKNGPLSRYHRAWRSNTYTLSERAWKCLPFPPPLLLHSLSDPLPVERSVNQLGRTGSCGAWEPLRLPTQLWALGSVALFRGWPAGPKWRSTTTKVTWNILSVTTNLSPPSLPCRWDTSGFFKTLVWYLLTTACDVHTEIDVQELCLSTV